MKPEDTLGYKLGLIVGSIIQLPRYIWLIVSFPFFMAKARRDGARFGEKLFRLDQDVARQRPEKN